MTTSIARAEVASEADLEAYCASRGRALPDSNETRTSACKVLVRGAMDSVAAHDVVHAVDQVRALDELMRRRTDGKVAACPPAPACPPANCAQSGETLAPPRRSHKPKPEDEDELVKRRRKRPSEQPSNSRDQSINRDLKQPSFHQN